MLCMVIFLLQTEKEGTFDSPVFPPEVGVSVCLCVLGGGGGGGGGGS